MSRRIRRRQSVVALDDSRRSVRGGRRARGQVPVRDAMIQGGRQPKAPQRRSTRARKRGDVVAQLPSAVDAHILDEKVAKRQRDFAVASLSCRPDPVFLKIVI